MARAPTVALALFGSVLLVVPVRAQAPQERPRVSLGILVSPTPPNAEQQGVIVREVPPDSPAAKAGMRPGDIIVKVGDREITDYEGLANLLAKHKPGDKVKFQVLRDGRDKTLTVTLGKRPDRPRPGGRRQTAFLGVDAMPPRPGAGPGVVVGEVVPDTPAARAGLKAGDVITEVNGREVAGPEQLRDAVRKAGPGKKITIKFTRGTKTREVKATLEESPGDVGFEAPPFPGTGPFGGPGAGDPRIRQLERQVRDLQRRVDDLERKLAEKSRPKE